MKVKEFRPSPAMQQNIYKFISLENDHQNILFKVIPRNYPAIIFMGPQSEGWKIWIGDAEFALMREKVYFAGLGFLPSAMHFFGNFKAWVIMLKPQMSRTVFGCSPEILINKIIPADPVLHRILIRINERIWEDTLNESEVKNLFENYLHPLFESKKPSPYLFKALEEIHTSNGLVNIKEVAEKVFTSNRNLLREFVNHTGVNPKKYASMVRFSCLMNDLMMLPKINLEALALSYNYYDISHLNKDAGFFLGNPLTGKNPFDKGLNDRLI